ncbi:MAG: SDR family oxidoreductase [Chloroflexi bacterium]|nr:SDR family oxidoreductase [Chloroflexota bacterium]
MDLGLTGKVALVAAASQGLGYGVARELAREGARVSICSNDQPGLEAAERKLAEETGAEVLATFCDVTKPGDVQAWVSRTVERWGVIDALFINAGGPPPGLIKDITDEQWQAAFELTLMSAIRMIRAALPHMTNGGAILTSTSSSVREPIEKLALSTVMRLGVVGLVKTLADEVAADGIRVNNIMPGRIGTERIDFLDQAAAKREGIGFEEVRARSIARIPLGRLGKVEEYGRAAAFLLSPAASYITGASLRVDGGMLRSI